MVWSSLVWSGLVLSVLVCFLLKRSLRSPASGFHSITSKYDKAFLAFLIKRKRVSRKILEEENELYRKLFTHCGILQTTCWEPYTGHRVNKPISSTVIYRTCVPAFLCLFESFRRDLNEAKAAFISEYYLVCNLVIMTLRLRFKFRLKEKG